MTEIASKNATSAADLQNKVTTLSLKIKKVNFLLQLSVCFQVILLLCLAVKFFINIQLFESRWLPFQNFKEISREINLPSTSEIDTSLVKCAMWQVCDNQNHFNESHGLSKKVVELKSFLRDNDNYRNFFAAQGVTSKKEAVANFYAINKSSGLKVSDKHVLDLKKILMLEEYEPVPAKSLNTLFFSLICLIGVAQIYLLAKNNILQTYMQALKKIAKIL